MAQKRTVPRGNFWVDIIKECVRITYVLIHILKKGGQMAEGDKAKELRAIEEQIEKNEEEYEKALDELEKFSDIGPDFYKFQINL